MKVKYTRFGMHGYRKSVQEEFSRFVQDLRIMFFDYLPPQRILNLIFRKGILDGGMSGGCKWKPFSIGQKEFRHLIQELKKQNILSTYRIPPPKIRTRMEWMIWVGSEVTGYPLEKSMYYNS